MLPTGLHVDKAYATTSTDYEDIKDSILPDYNHGTIAVSSDQAQADVIELEVGETATVTVSPYQHVQYEGCRMWNKPCPTVCDEMFENYGMEGSCFEKGKGCICTKTPSLETADVTAASTNESVATASAVSADTSISTASGVGTMADGSVTIAAVAPGESTVTVDADGLYFWYGGSKTYTVKVKDSNPASTGDPVQDENGFYQLDSADDLTWFADKVNAGEYSINAKLMSDIVLDDGILPAMATTKGEATAYAGTFDGGGFSISGISSFENTTAPAFITYLGGGTIKNLTLEGSVSKVPKSGAAFVNSSYGGTIEGCTNKVALDSTAASLAGFLYLQMNGSTQQTSIVSCKNEAAILSTYSTGYVGGIAASITMNGGAVEISKCLNKGAITGKYSVGGIVGKGGGTPLTISETVNEGVVTLTRASQNAGGILGWADAAMQVSVKNCYNMGEIVAGSGIKTGSLGGLYGCSGNSKTSVENSFSMGSITVPDEFTGSIGGAIGSMSNNGISTSLSNVYYLDTSCDAAVGGSVQPSVAPEAKTADEMKSAELLSALGSSFKAGAVSGHPILSWEPDESALSNPATIKADQKLGLRATDDSGRDVIIELEGATAEWAGKVTSVAVTPVDNDGTDEASQTLDASQYAIDTDKGTLTIHRTGDDPVISPKAGDLIDGAGIEVPSRWGSDTYPNAKRHKLTISADGYSDAQGSVDAGTLYSETLDLKQKTGETVDVSETVKADKLHALDYRFQNGSSQCSMAGVRTFSGFGVSVIDLLKDAGITVEEGDTITFECTDNFNKTFTYDEMFGSERYFIQGVYDDPDVQQAFKDAASSSDVGSTIEFRKAAAVSAIEDASAMDPMISDAYTETVLSGSEWMGTTPVPDESNTTIDSLVSLENQFRFIFGVKLVQEDCTVAFETGEGSAVDSQTVKSHLMTSTENTTINSKYWVKGITVDKGAAAPVSPSTAADKLTVPTDPEREGYTFGGWYTDEACTDGNEFDFEANDGTVDQNTKLYAKWVANAGSVDLDMKFPTDPSYVSTSMGRNPAGETSFSLKPSAEALTAYQAQKPGATTKQMLQAWIDGITSVSIDGTALTAREFSEWKSELTDPVSDQGKLDYYWLSALSSSASLELPVALFNTTNSETDTKTVTIESTGFGTVSGDVTYRNIGAQSLTVRVLDKPADEGGTVLYTKTLSMDQIKGLATQTDVATSANCGMAGLRSYMSEGVYLTDLLNAAGVSFDSGMTLKLRTTDEASTNDGKGDTEAAYISSGTFTYDELMGVARYHYPAMWDDTTTYAELGGKTIYSILSQDKDAWKSYASNADQAKALAKLLGQSKVEVKSPLLSWAWNEGVVAWGGSDPTTQSWGGSTYNQYTAQETFRFLFGMKAADDGSITDDNTTFSNTYGVFGIDIIDDDYTVVGPGPDPDPEPEPAAAARLGGDNRYGTMALVSQAAFPEAGSCSTVVIARGDNFPDALAAAGLAGVTGGQVLLTETSSLTADTKAEIKRLGAKKAYVIGDENSITARTLNEIRSLTGDAERLGGESRLDTAVRIYEAGKGGWGATAIVATGKKAADSLSASTIAYGLRAPIFLADDSGNLPAAALDAIAKGGFTNVIVLGDKYSVTDATFNKVKAAAGSAERIGGADRYATSRITAAWAFENGFDCDGAIVTAGRDGKYADALVASALGGKAMSPLLLVDEGEGASVCVSEVLAAHKDSISSVYVLGDKYTVSDELHAAINKVIS